jgi:hypothetical protein
MHHAPKHGAAQRLTAAAVEGEAARIGEPAERVGKLARVA